MENKQNKNKQQDKFDSNPEKSFEAGKKGSQGSQQPTNKSANNLNQDRQGETGQTGRKDISNNLEDDAVGKFGSNNPTPQARTDNAQDTDERRNDKDRNQTNRDL
jgi:hypothetical protein